jgi:ATP-dependent Clp protease adaptor protein ClpS
MTADTVIEKKKQTVRQFKEPNKYKVIVCNDDVTPMEFVIIMLMSIFKYNQDDAIQLTMKVHNDGSAVAGVYSHEIAEQKVVDATHLARNNNFPLVLKIEEVKQ